MNGPRKLEAADAEGVAETMIDGIPPVEANGC
jgi:hypothetical protein